jgi:hypothetical protein
MALEPLRGRRRVRVTDRRTAHDFAEHLRVLVEEDYADAEIIVLVTDNLNTHTPACLYERFEPAQARRIASKLEWHYTPEHGSWLNIAECELSVLARQCVSTGVSRTEPPWNRRPPPGRSRATQLVSLSTGILRRETLASSSSVYIQFLKYRT